MDFGIIIFSFFNILFLIFFFSKARFISKLLSLYKKNNSTPLVGGLGIWFFLLNYTIFFYLFYNELIAQHLFLISCISLIFFIGVLDDIIEINYKVRLFSIFVIIAIFINFEDTFLITYIHFHMPQATFVLNNSGIIITTFFLLLLLNSLNMADGINGNSAIILILYCVFIFEPNLDLNIFIYIIFISLIIFLFFNLKNKIYMGDSGIYLLSTFIGLYTIYKYNSDTTYLYSEEIFLIFMIPGIDMFRLFCKRLYNKKNPFKGDLDHLHHLLKNRYNLKISLTIYIILVAWPNIVAKLIVINHVYLIVINILVYSLLVINYKNKIN